MTGFARARRADNCSGVRPQRLSCLCLPSHRVGDLTGTTSSRQTRFSSQRTRLWREECSTSRIPLDARALRPGSLLTERETVGFACPLL